VFKVQKPVAFPLAIKQPAWSPKANVKATGAKVDKEGAYRVLIKEWRTGDKIVVRFDAPIHLQRLSNGEGVVRRGPLVYVLPIEEKLLPLPRKHKVFGFRDADVLPKRGFYGGHRFLDPRLEDCGFSVVRNGNADMNDPWSCRPLKLRGVLRHAGAVKKDFRSEATLVPIGSTLLRIAGFPLWPLEDGYFKR
jgi:hypothetical protein